VKWVIALKKLVSLELFPFHNKMQLILIS